MTLTRKGKRAAASASTAEEFLQSDHESVANGKEVEEDDAILDSEKRKRYIADWIGQPRNRPRETRMRKLRAKKKISVPLKPQQKTNPPTSNMRKIVSATRKMTANTPCSHVQKIPRKKLH